MIPAFAVVLACLAAACGTGTASAAGILYTMTPTDAEGGIVAGDEWTVANNTRQTEADLNGFNLVNSNTGSQSNYLILAFLTPLTGTPAWSSAGNSQLETGKLAQLPCPQ